MKLAQSSLSLALAAGLCLVTGVRAQSSSAPSSGAANEVTTLPEFNVSAQTDNGYGASESVTGSRVNTKLKDLPYAVDVLTSNFFQDFAIFDLTDDLSFMSSVNSNDDSGAFTVRGFSGSNTYLRNGLARLGLIDMSSLDRVELIKGPSASIYGQTSPGGALLITTKRPTTTPGQNFSATYGSYALTQEKFGLSGPIPLGSGAPKLFYLINGIYMHRRYDEPSQTRLIQGLTATLVYKFNEDTDLTFDANGQLIKNPNEWGLPYNVTLDSKGRVTHYNGYAWDLINGHYASPADYKSRSVWAYEGFFEHRFNDVFSMRLAGDVYREPIITYDTVRSSNYDPLSRQLVSRSSTPNWSTIYGSGHSYAFDLLAHYHTGKIDHQTLLTIDNYANNRGDYTNTAIAGTFVPIPKTLNVDNPVYEPYIPQDTAHFVENTTRNNLVDTTGFSLSHQMNLFNDRLLVFLSYRHDYVRGDIRDPATSQADKIHDSNDSDRIGLSYKLVPALSWYANRSESFLPFGTSPAIGTSPPSETGVSYETGLKAGLFHGKLGFTADVYSTKRKNVLVTELEDPNDPSSPTIQVAEGGQNSKGFEFSSTFNFSERVMGMLSYSYTDSRYVDQGVNVFANNRPPRGVPLNSVAGAVRYDLSHGFSLLLSMRYNDSTAAQSPTTGLIKNPVTGLYDGTDGRALIRNPAFAIWNVGMTYRWKAWHSSQSLNLTAKNIFNKRYIAGSILGDGAGVYLTYSLSH